MKQHYYQDFVIRPWQASDRQAVADLAQTILAEYDMGFEPDGSDWDVVQVEKGYWQTGGEFWVVEYQGRIVGSGGYQPCDRQCPASNNPASDNPTDKPPHVDAEAALEKPAELRKMFLYEDVRGRGVGRYLLNALEEAAAQQGFTHMWLETSVRMKAAVKLYERNGYQQPADTGVHVQRCDRVYVKTFRG